MNWNLLFVSIVYVNTDFWSFDFIMYEFPSKIFWNILLDLTVNCYNRQILKIWSTHYVLFIVVYIYIYIIIYSENLSVKFTVSGSRYEEERRLGEFNSRIWIWIAVEEKLTVYSGDDGTCNVRVFFNFEYHIDNSLA